jgi:hypothetical protein
LINEAASALRSDLDGRMCLIDRRGHCLIKSETQHSIRTLWQKVFARHDSTCAPIPQAIPLTNGAPTEPLFHLSGRIPQAELHLGGIEPPALRAAPQMSVDEMNGADDRPL